jgi:hypothetical protein
MPIRSGNSKPPYVVLLTGLPASGKTTLGKAVAESLCIPSIRSDLIKESIFDSIGYGTLAWSEFLTVVTRDISFRILPSVGPCIFDVFIGPEEAGRRLNPVVQVIIEIHCHVTYETAWRRFIERARSGRRHPGHLDVDVTMDFFRSSLEPQHVDKPFKLGGPLLEIDTTEFGDPAAACKWVRSEIDHLTQRNLLVECKAMAVPGASAHG